eukprot:gene28653-31824_t
MNCYLLRAYDYDPKFVRSDTRQAGEESADDANDGDMDEPDADEDEDVADADEDKEEEVEGRKEEEVKMKKIKNKKRSKSGRAIPVAGKKNEALFVVETNEVHELEGMAVDLDEMDLPDAATVGADKTGPRRRRVVTQPSGKRPGDPRDDRRKTLGNNSGTVKKEATSTTAMAPGIAAQAAGSVFPTTQAVTEGLAVAQGGGLPPAPCTAAGTARVKRKYKINKVGVETAELEGQGVKASSKQTEPATTGQRKRTHSLATDEIVKTGSAGKRGGKGKVGEKDSGVHRTETKTKVKVKGEKVGYAGKKDVVEVKKERAEKVQRPPGRKEENVFYVKHIREYRCNEEGIDEFKIRWWYYETDSEDTWETVELLDDQPSNYAWHCPMPAKFKV